MNTLFINACVRRESRTLVLAREAMKNAAGEITELSLEAEKIPPLDRELLARRDALVREGAFDDDMFRYARQFAAADEIFIAAPYWDLSFPAMLKVYFEQINVAGITFRYDNGRPVSLCRARRLVYVTTAGGEIVDDLGYAYVKALANNFYGITDTVSYRAAMLDVYGITAERLLADAKITTA